MQFGSFSRRAILCALVLAGSGACSAETPPYEELPLRDALSAAPDVIAALPEQARRDVAQRLEEAHFVAGEEAAIAEADIPSVAALVRTADAAREDEEKDSLVLAAIEPREGGFVLRGLGVGLEGEGSIEPSALSGSKATSTAALEEAALRGRAGAILGALGARVEAREIVRTTGVPAGVVAMDGTMYVNASWLVALSALEAPGEGQAAIAAPAINVAPPKAPQSVPVNPYKLPNSVNECAFDVKDVCFCAASLQCDHQQTDPTFANAQLECEWVNGADGRAEALCVLALMSMAAIRECVALSGSECSQQVVTNRDEALAFIADAACVDVLNACLQYGKPSGSVSSPSAPSRNACNSGCSGGSCDGCNNDCEQCNEDCSKCNDNCAKCNDNCDQCNENCRECDENQKNCKGAGGSSAAFEGGTSYCRMSRRASRVPESPVPFMGVLWFLAPAGYIARRIRRRA